MVTPKRILKSLRYLKKSKDYYKKDGSLNVIGTDLKLKRSMINFHTPTTSGTYTILPNLMHFNYISSILFQNAIEIANWVSSKTILWQWLSRKSIRQLHRFMMSIIVLIWLELFSICSFRRNIIQGSWVLVLIGRLGKFVNHNKIIKRKWTSKDY